MNYCTNPAFYSNSTATASIETRPTCWPTVTASPTISDVWLKFKAAGTDVQISVEGGGTAGTIKQPNLALYSGTCGSASLACKQAASNFTVLYSGGLIKGNFYLIRVGTTPANRGTFKLCISSYTPTVNPGSDCDGAVKLCDKSDVKVSGLKGGGLKAEIEEGSCFDTGNPVTLKEANSSWYKWTCATAGTLTFDMIPINPQNDMDFILYELNGTSTNPCGSRTILRCNASSCDRTRIPNGIIGLNMSSTDVDEAANCDFPGIIDGYLRFVNMVAGKTYLLMINNFSTAEGFTVKFGGTGTFAGPKAVITAATTNEVCAGGKVTFNGNSSINYHTLNWIFTSGTPATGTGIGPYKIDYLTPGTYMTYLKAIDSTCDSGNSLDSIKVTINGSPQVDANNPIITNTDCNKPSGSITNILVSGGTPTYSYEWFKLPSMSVSTDPDLTGVAAGDYYLIVTDSKTCKDSVGTFTIKPYDPPKTPGVSNNKEYCPYDPLEKITATGGGGTYTWYDDADLNNQIHVGPDYLPTNTVTGSMGRRMIMR